MSTPLVNSEMPQDPKISQMLDSLAEARRYADPQASACQQHLRDLQKGDHPGRVRFLERGQPARVPDQRLLRALLRQDVRRRLSFLRPERFTDRR